MTPTRHADVFSAPPGLASATDRSADRARRVLLVDPDGAARAELAVTLRTYGFEVQETDGPELAEVELARRAIDLTVLEPLMSGRDGLETCRRLLAASSSPLIILSTAAGPVDRVVGLEIGADDYVAKPAEPRELVARIRAVLRRSQGVRASGQAVFLFSGWRLDPVRHEVRAPDGGRAILTQADFALMRAFLDHPEVPLERRRLLEACQTEVSAEADLRGVDTQVRRLRNRLESCRSGGGALIQTVNGRGYMLDSPVVVEGAPAA